MFFYCHPVYKSCVQPFRSTKIKTISDNNLLVQDFTESADRAIILTFIASNIETGLKGGVESVN